MHLNGKISKNALHLFVHNGRHGVKEALGLLPIVQGNKNPMKEPDELQCQYDSGIHFLLLNNCMILH